MAQTTNYETMTPKEKAKELIKKYEKIFDGNYIKTDENIKQCALICVDEIIKTCNKIVQSNDVAPYYNEKYWQEVRSEINDK